MCTHARTHARTHTDPFDLYISILVTDYMADSRVYH